LSRLDVLRQVRGRGVRWVSAEPLLEYLGADVNLSKIGWLIVGGESGRDFRPMDHAWASSLERQCKKAGVPFFFKQSSGFRPETGIEMRGEVRRALPRRN
jgi:protein gp37